MWATKSGQPNLKTLFPKDFCEGAVLGCDCWEKKKSVGWETKLARTKGQQISTVESASPAQLQPLQALGPRQNHLTHRA